MNRKEAKQILIKQGRFSYNVKTAKRISEAFGLELDKSIIRTTRGYRENIKDAKAPRVTISRLSKNICERLGKAPDKETLKTANQMCGEGSYHDLLSQAYALNL